MPSFRFPLFFQLALISSVLFTAAPAQEASTGAIRGTVTDAGGARIGAAIVVLVNAATNFRYSTTTDISGRFAFELLPPGDYSGRVESRRECRRKPPRVCTLTWAARPNSNSSWRSLVQEKASQFPVNHPSLKPSPAASLR